MSEVQHPLLDAAIDAWPLPPDGRSFRREQLAAWVFQRGERHFESMTDLPANWRRELARQWRIDPFEAVAAYPSSDASVRYLFTLADGRRTEAVFMPYRDRNTVCLSSMVGCPAGCTFCATGALGFGRNLSSGEIVAQLLAVAWHQLLPPSELRNVVLMGMGEALLNYRHALAAIRTLLDPRGLGLSPRRLTLSTVGLPERIRRLAGEGIPLVLAVSLHAPDDETRRRIVPTAHAHPITEIIAALHDWQTRIGRRVTIEYTMLAGVNDHLGQAAGLAERLAGLRAHINLIPFNPWPGSGFASSSKEVVARFRKRLEEGGLSVSVRFSRGRDAGGACGQLALQGASAGTSAAGGSGLSP